MESQMERVGEDPLDARAAVCAVLLEVLNEIRPLKIKDALAERAEALKRFVLIEFHRMRLVIAIAVDGETPAGFGTILQVQRVAPADGSQDLSGPVLAPGLVDINVGDRI